MRRRFRISASFGLAALAVVAGTLALPEPAAPRAPRVPRSTGVPGELWAAALRVDITPPPGSPLGGYGGGRRRRDPPWIPDLDPSNYFVWFRPYEGVHDPIYAKMLLLDNGQTKLLFVKMDTIGATETFRRDIAERAARYGIDPAGVFVTGTHTHGGPGALADEKIWAPIAMDTFDLGLYWLTIGKVWQGIDALQARLEPARIGVGRGESYTLSRNRRDHPGRFDPEIGVIAVQRVDGRPLATVFNFAVHGTALGADNLLVTRDLMGYAEDKLEATLGGPSTAIFINGAEGDVSPNTGGQPDFDGAKYTGEGLADAVLGILPGIQTQRSILLEARRNWIQLPPPFVKCSEQWDSPGNICNDIPDQIPDEWRQIKLDGMVDEAIGFHALRIGNTVAATVPGEPITNVGLDIKAGIRQRGYENAFIFGCANGHIAYITNEEEYYEGGYEAQSTLYGPETGDIVTAAALQAVDLLGQPSTPTVRVR